MIIQVKSAGFDSGNFAKITINEVPIVLKPNSNDHYRGLHIVLVSLLNKKIIFAKVFDTYKSSVDFDKFIQYEVPDGHIVVAACKDDCVTKLSENGKLWFENMGSKDIRNLKYRCGFAFIGISGSKTDAQEKIC